MPETPITKILVDPKACDLPDKYSVARELFVEKHEPAKLRVYALNEEGINLFQKLPKEVLPVLPFGYQWTISEAGRRSIIKIVDSESHNLEVVNYGPDRGKINYNFLVDGVTWHSFAHTKQGKGPKRSEPMTIKDYTVPGFEYEHAKGYIAKSHIRGHCIDRVDTMLVGGHLYSSNRDPRNYIPEPHYKYWGCQMRRCLVEGLRKDGNGYMQLVHYPEKCLVTKNGTKVPDYVYFYPVYIVSSASSLKKYSVSDAYSIDWNMNYHPLRPKDKSVVSFSESYKTEGAPKVLLWDAAQSDSDARSQVRDMYKRTRSIDSGKISTLHCSRDSLFAKTACAEIEFESSRHRFNAAIQASAEREAGLARNELTYGLDYSDNLIKADIRNDVVDSAQLLKMNSLFKAEASGFEDPDDQQIDHLSQISKEFCMK